MDIILCSKRNLFILLLALFTLYSCGKNTSSILNSATPAVTSNNFLVDFSSGLGKLTSPGNVSAHYFGWTVAVGDFNGDGDKDLAVGAPLSDIGTTNSGAVYIYYSINDYTSTGVADVFIQPGNNNNNEFGSGLFAADLNGDGADELIVGAPTEDRIGTNSGSVYIFNGSTSGINQSPSQIIDHPTFLANGGFGSAIHLADLDGDGYKELLVGARFHDTATDANVGGAWILTGRSTGAFDGSTATLITLSNALGDATDYCGSALFTHDYSNDGKLDIYIGCPNDDTAAADSGAIRIWNGTGVQGTWVTSSTVPDTTISNPSALATHYFGQSIVVFDYNNDGLDDLLVGAPLSDYAATNSGGIFIFEDIKSSTNSDGIQTTPSSEVTASYFANGMAVSDINNDGEVDLIIGSPLASPLGTANGRVEIFKGESVGAINFSANDIEITYEYHISPTYRINSSGDYFGSALCKIDYNGDGLKDLIVGAYQSEEKSLNDGSVYVYYARSSGKIFNIPDVRIRTNGAYNSTKGFGKSCLALDINRDGYDDLLIGAINDDSATTNAGAVYVYYGNSNGVSPSSSGIFFGPVIANYGFGSALAAGDLNNDGFNDLVVGAYLADAGGVNSGSLYVFESNNTTGIIDLNNYTTFQHTGPVAADYLGYAAITYDVDGDGDQDLLGGAYGDDTNASANGIVYIWTNPGTVNTLLDTTHDTTIGEPGSTVNVGFGSGLAKGKYLNSTYEDLLIGAMLDDSGGTDGGIVYIHEGEVGGYNSTPELILSLDPSTNDSYEWLGASMLIFDFNQDGVNDIIIGAPTDDESGIDAGSVYIKVRD